ncbi:MAG: archease [Phycisphaerae bacterium]
MEPGFELFDHTADIGVRVFASSLPELVRPAGEGLYAVIGELVPAGEPRAARFDFRDHDPPFLLRDYLAELLLLFECDRRIMTTLDVEAFWAGRLAVAGESRAVNKASSLFHHEVKAITYHELGIRSRPGGYEATYIVDI